jgi:putative ABC transport system ATP-binding protein
MRLLRNACKGGAAAVLATHDARLAAWADRVVFFRDGVAVDHTAPAAGPESLLTADSGPPR